MFRIGVTRDFLKPDGSNGFGDIGLELLTSHEAKSLEIEWEYMPPIGAEILNEIADKYDGILVLGPRVTRNTVYGAARLKVIARFGVGYDNIDVQACTEAGVLLTITPEGVRRPVAVAALTFLLALSHKLLIKDRLTREGRWAEKLDYIGQGLTGRVLGIVGLGNIGRELATIVQPLGMQVMAADPLASEDTAKMLGVKLIPLDTLMKIADYVCITCALTEQTRHLIDAERISLMKPSAYLINVARGPIVDQDALTKALAEKRISGAGLDVFDPEPISPDDPLLKFENVILAPHAICWTDECFGLNGRSAIQSLLDVAAGIQPRHIVNREVLHHARLSELVESQ